ncbi:hypothetical protein MMC13_005404 [Lambiella insularis]|nr:hypothetical protein [Lambiella insularis]
MGPRPLTQLETYDPVTKHYGKAGTRDTYSEPQENAAIAFSTHSTHSWKSESARPAVRNTVNEEASPVPGKGDIISPRLETNGRRVINAPRKSYHTLMSLDQAGPSTIGYDDAFPPKLVAIKRTKKPNEAGNIRLPRCSSKQLITILDVYLDVDEIVFVYEIMEISLRQVINVSSLQTFQIAAICEQVVNGLSYLHQELVIAYGLLSCSTVLLDSSGRIKLANVGDALVTNRELNEENERVDISRLGSVMMELMEPMTFILEPGSVILRDPVRWQSDTAIQDFLAATQRKSLNELAAINHTSLDTSKINNGYKSAVCIADPQNSSVGRYAAGFGACCDPSSSSSLTPAINLKNVSLVYRD